MTISFGPNRVARCDGCGALWLDAASCRALVETDLDPAARSLATGPRTPRRAVRGPFRDACENGASTRACPVCLRELTSLYVRDADVRVGSCEHGVLIAEQDVAAFLLASDIRRTLAEVEPPQIPGLPRPGDRGPLPGGMWLRFGAALFLLSLAVPAAHVSVLWSKSHVVGLFGAVFGPLVAIEHPLLALPVIANFVALSLLVVSRRLSASAGAVVSTIFGAGAFCTVCFGLGGEVEVLPGYWMWCVALVLFAVGTWVRSAWAATVWPRPALRS